MPKSNGGKELVSNAKKYEESIFNSFKILESCFIQTMEGKSPENVKSKVFSPMENAQIFIDREFYDAKTYIKLLNYLRVIY